MSDSVVVHALAHCSICVSSHARTRRAGWVPANILGTCFVLPRLSVSGLLHLQAWEVEPPTFDKSQFALLIGL